MTRPILILSLIVAGALILASLISCQAPQVCKHCWVATGN